MTSKTILIVVSTSFFHVVRLAFHHFFYKDIRNSQFSSTLSFGRYFIADFDEFRKEWLLRGTDGNFERRTEQEIESMGLPYDIGSVMHYGQNVRAIYIIFHSFAI